MAMVLVAEVRAGDDLTRPIRVSPDGHFLTRPDGKPFFYLGENVETLFWRLTNDETDLYLEDRASKGFTVILAQILPKDNLNAPNAYGQTAFIDGDVSRPNEMYFKHIDWVVDKARSYGLRIGLAPAQGITHVASHVFTEANAEPYARWLGYRYRGKGVIWLLGWDSTPIWADNDSYTAWSHGKGQVRLIDYRPIYDLMAKGIAEGEGDVPFITFHPPCCSFPGTAEPRTSLYLNNRDWLDMNMLQSSHFLDPTDFVRENGFAFGWNSTCNYEPIRKEYDSQPTRPVIDGEPQYEDIPRNLDAKIGAGRWDQVDIRNSAYHSVFAGAAGHDYNDLNVVGFHTLKIGERPSEDDEYKPNTPWKEALNAPGAQQIHHLKDLMLSRPYFTRIPDQSVVVSDTFEGSAHISGTRDRTGSYVMIYLPLGQQVWVDMNKLSGSSAIAWWYDPRTGKSTRIEGRFQTNRHQRFVPPSSGRSNDWVLVLDDASKGFAVPGALDTE